MEARVLTGNHSSPLPKQRGLYYGGAWHDAAAGRLMETINPATGESLGHVADADAQDVARAVAAAKLAFKNWRQMAPGMRADKLREFASILRANAEELALIDAIDCGNPVRELIRDVGLAAEAIEYFAGLARELKGETVPLGADQLNYIVREPLGVVVKIVAFNHPLMFAAMKCAAPIVAGNTVIVKPSEQAPLSALRMAELAAGIFPSGVLNVLTGGRECGAALTSHADVAKVSLIGSAATGRAILRNAAETIKPVTLELGGKNALIVCMDADVDAAAEGIVRGMNFAWAGQSCGSSSRVFVHHTLYDRIVDAVAIGTRSFKPGDPADPVTTMGSLASRQQHDRVLRYIEWGKEDGARLVCGGKVPVEPQLANGFFIEPTVFADVKSHMRIAREEIFGPILSILSWSDLDELVDNVNEIEYGLTASIWTRDLDTAHQLAARIEAGYIWINQSSTHFLGTPFGGYKQSGLGREENLEELISYTQSKSVTIKLSSR